MPSEPAELARAIDAPFAALDTRFKEACLRWQQRELGSVVAPNDHSDPIYDEAVLAEIATVVVAGIELLAELGNASARVFTLVEALEEALAAVRQGDLARVTGVREDSLHHLWWKLHGELLGLLGRPRD